MSRKRDQDELWEKALKGKVTLGDEREWAGSEAGGDELEEIRETIALGEMMRVSCRRPTSSNFTERVVRAAEIQQGRSRTAKSWRWGLRFALGVALVAGGVAFAVLNRNEARERARAEQVAEVTELAAPSLEILRDFEAIQRLGDAPVLSEPDVDFLLTALP